MVFNFRDGWSEDKLKLFHSLAKRYLVMLEETAGQWECTVTAHNLLHIVEDIYVLVCLTTFGADTSKGQSKFEAQVKVNTDLIIHF